MVAGRGGSGRALLLTALLSGVGCGASTTTRTSGDVPSADDGIDAEEAPSLDDAGVDASADAPRDDLVDARTDATTEDRGDDADAPSDLGDRDAAPDAPPADTKPVDGGGVLLCAADSECDDGIACTTDACLTGVCAHLPRNESCAAGELCDLRRGCVLGAPCTTNAQCLDDDPCTHEFCSLTYGRCRYYLTDDDADDHVSIACGGGDCDDARGDVHPGVSEVCNGRDDDCDGQIDEDPGGALCGAGGVCPSGACECVASGTTLCGGRCVDPSTDAAHCGGCGVRCRADQVCAEGRCACAAGITECGGACADLSRDVANCGACGNACPRTYGEGCQSGRCACLEGRTPCGSGAEARCADTTSDAANCNVCGNACPADATCASRRCVCRTPGQTVCGSRCVATERDAANCGGCGNVCSAPSRALAVCDIGACRWVCEEGRGDCDGDAANGCETDTASDANHCGACGRRCPDGAACARGACPGEAWARWVGRAGTNASNVTAVATDARRNVFAVGDIALGATVGDDTLTGTGQIFVASFGPTGEFRWGRALSGTLGIFADDVAVDAASNVYVVGWFSGRADFGGGAVMSSGNEGFVASYSGAGDFRWVRCISRYARGLAADPSGNLVVVGDFSGTVDFGDGPRTATSSDGYALALTSSGDFRWVTQLRGARVESLRAAAFDASGEVTVVGQFEGTAQVDDLSVISTGGQDGIAIRLSTTGGPQWARRFGGSGDDAAYGVTVDASGGAYVVGGFTSSGFFSGDTTWHSAGGTDGYVVALDPAGTPRWARRLGGEGSDGAQQVALDGAGALGVTGWCNGLVDFGGPTPSDGGANGYLLTLTTEGRFRDARRFGTTRVTFARGVAYVDGSPVVCGYFTEDVTFGAGLSLMRAGSSHGFIARLSR